jgi:hypothetical protein
MLAGFLEEVAVDEKQFDRLVRSFGGTSRRGVITAAVGLMALRWGEALGSGRSRKRGGDAVYRPGSDTILICHKPGSRAQQNLLIASSALPAHLQHGDHVGSCCPDDYLLCNGRCCPPPPQGGKARCCPDGSCGCAGACCGADCFQDNKGRDAPVVEWCCVGPDWEICPTPDRKETCCRSDQFVCACIDEGGIAGSYRRR